MQKLEPRDSEAFWISEVFQFLINFSAYFIKQKKNSLQQVSFDKPDGADYKYANSFFKSYSFLV